MEWRAPRLADFSLADVTLDVFPIHKCDLLIFCHTARVIGDEEAERIVKDAIELATLADDIIRFYRQLASDIRRLEKESSRSPEAALKLKYMHGGRLNILNDAALVKQQCAAVRLGKYFPLTRSRLSKRLSRLTNSILTLQRTATPSEVATVESVPLQSELLPPQLPLWFAQTPSKTAWSAGTLKTLRDRYSSFYKKR